MPVPSACSKITRREALALGAAAGVTAAVGAPGSALGASLSGAMGGAEAPSYLRRSTYASRVGEEFTLGPHVLRLVHVGDVQGADLEPSMHGRDDAFDLAFDGPVLPLVSAIHELAHALLGPFPLFIGPEGPPHGGVQTYGATIDRSVRVKRPPTAPSHGSDTAPAASADAEHPAEPTARDVAILEERRVAQQAPMVERRVRARRAHRKLRRTLDARIRFKRKQHARMHRARTGWLKRHFG
ncbi:MAG TPA: hypothetical protein VF549_21995 [Solirubrobacteraceae bacterium]|jgi:hypothetical protein